MRKIGIIEDDNNLRSSIEAFIEIDEDLELIFSFESVEKWQAEYAVMKEPPSLLLIDIGLPGWFIRIECNFFIEGSLS